MTDRLNIGIVQKLRAQVSALHLLSFFFFFYKSKDSWLFKEDKRRNAIIVSQHFSRKCDVLKEQEAIYDPFHIGGRLRCKAAVVRLVRSQQVLIKRYRQNISFVAQSYGK